jgi:hypothetical protein
MSIYSKSGTDEEIFRSFKAKKDQEDVDSFPDFLS